MAILNNSNAISSGGYDINNSLRFRRSASAYLNRTPASSGSQTTWTYSTWFKRGALGLDQILITAGATNNDTNCYITSSDKIYWFNRASATMNGIKETTQVFRDSSAWYHIMLVWDTTQGTASNRMKIYVNGSQVTAFSSSTDPASSTTSFWNSNVSNKIASDVTAGSNTLDGYLTEINFIDGQALTPSSFGETDTTTGSWKPKAYTGTYGTNGFYLKFSDIATTSGSNAGLGKDFSGNANYWTTNNISVTAGTTYDAMIDSPTLTSATVANYPTLNPLSNTSTLTEANLTATNILLAGTTMATPSSGKYYFEYTQTTSIPSGSLWVGVASNTSAIADNQLQGYAYASDGRKVAYNSYTSGYGATWTTGDVIGCALDLDNQTITFYKNNTSQGTAFTSITQQPYVFALSAGGAASTKGGSINCGQRPFTYTPPTGFVRLNTYNLPDSTIKKGNTVMDATTYTGTGATQVVTNSGSMKPDLVWLKSRSVARDHRLMDTVRGINLGLQSDLTNAEYTGTALSSINSNGFTLNTTDNQNVSAETYIAWQWQAGQGSTSSNTNGSITSTVSVNATAGFSVVTYTGTGANATVGHGLGVAPKMYIVKNRSAGSTNWVVYHASLGATKWIELSQTTAAQTSSSLWNDTAPTSTVFSVGNAPAANGSTNSMVAYCWAAIAGYSAFTSYTGNNSDDGPFVYLGFRPKFVMIKDANAAGYWAIFDSNRATYNVVAPYLQAQSSAAEVTIYSNVDFLANGIKLRANNANSAQNNLSGNTYIVAAWAENPFKNSNAR